MNEERAGVSYPKINATWHGIHFPTVSYKYQVLQVSQRNKKNFVPTAWIFSLQGLVDNKKKGTRTKNTTSNLEAPADKVQRAKFRPWRNAVVRRQTERANEPYLPTDPTTDSQLFQIKWMLASLVSLNKKMKEEEKISHFSSMVAN